MNGSQISLDSGEAINGPLIPAIFPEAKELAVILCTIGPKLEKQVTDYSKSKEAMRGMILDGIGSTAVDMMTLEVLRRLTGEVSSRGYEISSPVNPGMPGFPLTEQWNLLGLVNATRWTPAQVCARCSLRETCYYKVTKYEENS